MSDLHGLLPLSYELKNVDVIVLCGDVVPLEYQRSSKLTKTWLQYDFKAWIDSLKCEKVIMISGNHDFFFSYYDSSVIKNFLNENVGDKLVYLEDESYTYNGVKFYGCPWCKGPYGWAFCPKDTNLDITKYYEMIEDCDVLLTHQPAAIGNIGTSYYWTERPQDWSSKELLDAIDKKNILVNFCGHIHSGSHNRVTHASKEGATVFYNVSLMGETYNWDYEPRYVSIDTEKKIVNELK